MAFNTAFQTSAFQQSAFQIAGVVAGGVIQPAGQFSRSRWRKITEEEARKRLLAQQEAEWAAQRAAEARRLGKERKEQRRIAARDARFAEQDRQFMADALKRAGIAADQIHSSALNLARLSMHSNALEQMIAKTKADQEEEEEMLMLLELA